MIIILCQKTMSNNNEIPTAYIHNIIQYIQAINGNYFYILKRISK